MPASTDAQRRPVYIDRVNNRLLAEPVGAGAWPVVPIALGSLGSFTANTLIGRYGTDGELQSLNADVTIQLLNSATVQTIAAARVVAGSTSSAGVLQLTDSTGSTSTTTAATPNSVKAAYDLAGTANAAAAAASVTASAALPTAGGTMTGNLEIGAAGSLSFEGSTANDYETILAVVDPTADRTVSLPDATTTVAGLSVVQTFTVAQRGAVAAQGSVSGTVTLNFAAANNFSMTLPAGGSVTLGNPSNLAAGQSGVVVITQNATTVATVSYGSYWKFAGGTAPPVTATTNAVDVLSYYVASATVIIATLTKDLK
jgi:hypothetical protein